MYRVLVSGQCPEGRDTLVPTDRQSTFVKGKGTLLRVPWFR